MTLVWRPGFQFDADASTYIEAVEAADTQALETGVRYAINDFVIGCKNDGIWDAIKASCILAGARTLDGALIPLVGTAPTNFNFVFSDYNRETGLGDSSNTTKYLNSNRNNNSDPQNSKHLACYVSTASTAKSSGRTYLGAESVSSGSSWLHGASTSNLLSARANSSSSAFDLPGSASLTGFVGVARNNNASSLEYRYSSSTASASASSDSPVSASIHVFNGLGMGSHSNARLAFYSIGESLDLAALDTRVSALITAIGAAIP